MTINIGVLHPSPVPPTSTKQIIIEARKLGYNAKYLRPQELSAYYNGKEVLVTRRGLNIELDIAFPRGTTIHGPVEQHIWRTDIIVIMEEKNVTTINNYKSINQTRDKALTPLLLMKNGLPTPNTIITEDINTALQTIVEWKKTVIKPIMGSLGRGIILVDNPDIAYPILKQLLGWGEPILLQKYIEKKRHRDLRILVINGEAYASYYRISRKNSFKTNLAQGAMVRKANPSEELKDIAVRTSEALDLFYAGIDIAESASTNEAYILEANASPNWRGAVTLGLNPAKKLVAEAVNHARK